jgi:hypothetical protein
MAPHILTTIVFPCVKKTDKNIATLGSVMPCPAVVGFNLDNKG